MVMLRGVMGGQTTVNGGERERLVGAVLERERQTGREKGCHRCCYLLFFISLCSIFLPSVLLCFFQIFLFFFLFSPCFSLPFSISQFVPLFVCFFYFCFPPLCACCERVFIVKMHAFCVCVWRGCAESRGSRCRGAEVCCGVFCRGTGAAEPWVAGLCFLHCSGVGTVQETCNSDAWQSALWSLKL